MEELNIPTEIAPPPQKGRFWRVIRLSTVLMMALTVGVAAYLQSDAFSRTLRGRVVDEIEKRLGARVTLEEFSFTWLTLTAHMGGLSIERAPTAQPAQLSMPAFLSVRSVDATWSLLSIWPLRADLESLQLLEPLVQLHFQKDGTNNIPSAPAGDEASGRWAEQLIGLRIRRFEIVDGELIWNEQRMPLSFRAERLNLTMKYHGSEGSASPGPEPSYAGALEFANAQFKRAEPSVETLDANVKFRLLPERVELSEIKLATERSTMDASLTVNDLRSLNLAVTYDARVDWSEAGPWLGLREWEGSVRWHGQGTVTSKSTQLSGALDINTVRTGIPRWEHIPWKLSSDLLLSRQAIGGGKVESRASFPNLRIAALGGEWTGKADLDTSAPGLQIQSELQAKGLKFAEVASALRALPVDLLRLPWATEFSGPVEISYSHPPELNPTDDRARTRGLQVKVDLAAQPPAAIPEGLMPVSGAVRATYVHESKRLENVLAEFVLPGASLHAEGSMQENESSMRLGLDATQLDTIRPAADLFWQGFSSLPLRLDGAIHAESTWTGGWRAAAFRGPARLTGITYGDDRWDIVSGDVQAVRRVVESANAEGLLTRHSETDVTIRGGKARVGQSEAEFDLELALRDGKFLPESRFQSSGKVSRFDVALIQKTLGTNVQLSGIVDGKFHAAGTRGNPRGQASVAVSEAALYGEKVDRITAEIQFEPGPIITLNPVRLRRIGTVSGSATIRPTQRGIELNLTAEDFPLNQLPRLSDLSFPIHGVLAGNLAGQGTYDALDAKGSFRLRDAGAGQMKDGELDGEFLVNGNLLHWTTRGSFLGAEVDGEGTLNFVQPYPLKTSLRFRNGVLRNFKSIAQQYPDGLEGAFDAEVQLGGNAADANSLAASGEISRLEVSRMGVSMRNMGPVTLQFQNRQLRVDALRLVGDQVDVTTSGTILTTADPTMNLRATGTIDLASLSKLDPQVATQGRAVLDAQISGTFRRPLWRGRLVVQDASAQFGRLANSLSAIQGTVVFDGTRGTLEGFRAVSGGGEVLIGGGVRYGEGSGLQFNLNGTVRNVRLRYPEALSTWIDGQLNWTGSTRSSLLEGRVTIKRHSIAPPNDLAQVLFSRRRSPAQPIDSPFLQNLRLNLSVNSAPEVRLDTRTARNLQTAFDARIQGTGAQPAVLGRIGILSGEVEFAGKRYTINRGEVTFLNPFRFEPELNLNVQARVQQYDITMDFSGPPDRLNVTYRSDPPLPTRDILALLVAGGARQTSLQPSAQALPQVTADSLLSQALSSQIGSRLDRIFGSGRVRVDPQLNTLSGTASATVALEQQIRNNITLLYATDVSSAQQQYVQGEWIINPKLSVVGIRDQNGLVGVNFQITLRFE